MREQNKLFHLAIPCDDLDKAKEFYSQIGCQLARRYHDRVTFNFFGDQIVCHLCDSNEIDTNPQMYPRHFGITFLNKQEFEQLLESAKKKELPFFQEPMTRFKGMKEEHTTFFLIDPSNNLLEFKYYNDESMIY